MFRIGFFIYEGCYLSSLSGPIDAFQIANAFAKKQLGNNTDAFFSWSTIGLNKDPITTSCGIRLTPDTEISAQESFDLLYIPSFPYKGIDVFEQLSKQLTPSYEWLKDAWENGVVICSNCTSAFILAETGLLNDKLATTAWWLERVFANRYPNVNLDITQLITEQDNIVCAGAGNSHQNLAMNLIEKQFSKELAIQCAKTLMVDARLAAQSPYQNLLTAAPSEDPVIQKAQHWLHTHMNTNIDLAWLAADLGVSQRTLIRKFKAELDETPIRYLQNIRIEAAKSLLETTKMPIPEIVEQIGYSDLSAFSKLFKQRTQLTPKGYRLLF
jgi:transcriptional regulator GlxA family with amidase domain